MSVLATDNFNRANANPIGGNWSAQGGQISMQLLSNAVANINDSQNAGINYNAISWPNDQYSKAVITAPAGYGNEDGPAVGVRMTTVDETLYQIAVNHAATNNLDLQTFVSGSFSSLLQTTQAWTDGDTWEIRAQGTTISVYLNGSAVSGASATDSGISSGRAGLGYSSDGTGKTATWDNWEGGDFASGLPPGLGPDVGMTEPLLQAAQAAMMR